MNKSLGYLKTKVSKQTQVGKLKHKIVMNEGNDSRISAYSSGVLEHSIN